jgi:uncharacterized protein YfaS (alpha-2-macroglobulin family)
MPGKIPATRLRRRLKLIVFTLILLSLACSLPSIGRPTGTSPATTSTSPTPTSPPPTPAQPLPPALVESQPAPGAEIPLDSAITLYFNQAMDRRSVAQALQIQPDLQAQLAWQDEATLSLQPGAPLQPNTSIQINLSESARSAQGLSLTQPLSLTFQSAGFLRLAQALPEPDTQDVDPTSAVVAAFNRPIATLGPIEDPPPAFTLEPQAQGRGQWLNTSTYIFYPDPALEGGKTYTVQVPPDLTGVDGSPLKSPVSWSFTTASPQVVSVTPQGNSGLDTPVEVTFNQPMDVESVGANLQVTGPGGPVAGKISWNDDNTVLTFTPDSLLARRTSYTVNLSAGTLARGGTPLGADLQHEFSTFPPLAVTRTEPPPGNLRSPNAGVSLYFSAPLPEEEDLLDYVSFEPSVSGLNYWWDSQEMALRLFGNFAPDTEYTLTVSGALADKWNGPLGQDYTFSYRTTHLQPSLYFAGGTNVIFLTPQDESLQMQVTNIFSLPVESGRLPLQDFLSMLGPQGYQQMQDYTPSDASTWVQSLDIPPDRSQTVEVSLNPGGQPLSPGLYLQRFSIVQEGVPNTTYLLAVSHIQLTFKLSPTDALVWALDLRDNQPLAGETVTIYSEAGEVLASGETDSEGIFSAALPDLEDLYANYYAVMGEPGQENFALALSNWDQGIGPWNFQITSDPRPPHLEVYVYTDRPIYRPGQSVYFRAVARQAYNGRYQMPDISSLPLTVYGSSGEELATYDLPLSAFGTAHGEYLIPEGAQPGYYTLRTPLSQNVYRNFQVAEYRKPEINLQVNFESDQALAGEPLTASVNARYFFDAPAGNLPVHWSLYQAPDYFYLPEYQVGSLDTWWLEPFRFGPFPGALGSLVAEGDAQTQPDGTLALDLPAPEAPEGRRQRYTLEITAQDESGLPVSNRASIHVNPAQFYIGVQPDAWVGRAGDTLGFDVQLVDWEQQPDGARPLSAEFRGVEWVRKEAQPGQEVFGPTFEARYTPIGSTDFTTSADGQARLAFVPPDPGTYQLDVHGGGARTSVLLWVSGPGQAVWPNLPNQRLDLSANQESYLPGESAQIFIPNPLGEETRALLTVERGTILRHQVLDLAGSGTTIELPLSDEDAPNVYVSVTLIGRGEAGQPDFRQGYLNLTVQPVQQTLNVQVTSQPERAGPGEEATFEIQVSDQDGNPVQGEFSLSVVDRAVLALADPNAPDIVPAFYGKQPLGVRTGLDLAAYGRRQVFLPPGMGGGGGGDMGTQPVVRENFPDTAFWDAQIRTDAEGRASVSLTLPDSLTTWKVEARGLSEDTRVGQAQTDLVTTKPLLVRPATPRFLVAGDHVQLAAVVQNNTDQALHVQASLQAQGVNLDESGQATQPVDVAAGGRARLEWWGTVQSVNSADLVFSAVAGDLSDAARPANGALPVLRYNVSQTFRTAGVMEQGGQRLELVSLPRSFDVINGGELNLDLSPSLAAGMLDALQTLEHFPYECTEQTLSRFLPNIETYRALQQFGVETPELSAQLERNVEQGLNRLLSYQNPNGGWPWWQGGQSDPYVSAYVLFGLQHTREAGFEVPESVLQEAIDYLRAGLPTPQMVTETWQFDRLVFQHYVLAIAGSVEAGDLQASQELFQERGRLSAWSRALLALTLEQLSPDSQAARTLLSDLESSAIRSASGAFWALSDRPDDLQSTQANMVTTLTNSAMVVYALAQRDPGSLLLPDAVRYLMANRQAEGGWSSTYTSSWTLMALAEFVKGTGELGGNFDFSAAINGTPLASGQAQGVEQFTSVTAQLPLQDLRAGAPNGLVIERAPGPGRLYYTAGLTVNRPVEDVSPLAEGLQVTRDYYLIGDQCDREDCPPVGGARIGDRVQVRLTLTVPEDRYYLLVEDFIPAGAEILDTRLKTSQQGEALKPGAEETRFDPRSPYQDGWGWWLFQDPQIYDDHISWAVDFLPAGTYELTYTLVPLQPGEFRVLPARAWQFYFPEVQGSSAGSIFTIGQ